MMPYGSTFAIVIVALRWAAEPLSPCLAQNLPFGLEPIFEVLTVHVIALLKQLVRPVGDRGLGLTQLSSVIVALWRGPIWPALGSLDPHLHASSPPSHRYASRLVLQLVQCVQGRYLVTFGQSRIVEYRVEEVVEAAIEGQHGLADMNQFRRAGADGVDA